MKLIKKEQISNFIYGFVIGDAIGVPFEFQQSSNSRRFEFKGFGTHNQEPGTWSDDTSLMFCQIESIHNDLSINNLKSNLINWLYNNKFTANDKVFDIGASTRKVIEDLYKEKLVDNDEYKNFKGNGTLLRIISLSFINIDQENLKDIIQVTTKDEETIDLCQTFIKFTNLLIKGVDKIEAFEMMFKDKEKIKISSYKLNQKPTGLISDTINCVLYCFLNSCSYKDSIEKAINLGGDTDSIAAITGALSGFVYKDIPLKFKNTIKNKDLIDEMIEKLYGTITERQERAIIGS